MTFSLKPFCVRGRSPSSSRAASCLYRNCLPFWSNSMYRSKHFARQDFSFVLRSACLKSLKQAGPQRVQMLRRSSCRLRMTISLRSSIESIIGMVFSIEILETGAQRLRFVLSNCDSTFANSLRRIMIAEVPTMAIHIVNLYENTSVLNDEFICHRLGLVPLVSDDVDRFNYPWACKCKDAECQNCKVTFELSVKNTEYDMLTVTSLHFKEAAYTLMDHPVRPLKLYSKIRPSEEVGIPLLKLGTGQSLHLKCEAQKGIGKMHAKWSPVAVANFIPEPEVILDQERMQKLSIQQMRELAESCPRDVFTVNQRFGIIEVNQPRSCIFCNECKKKAAQFQAGNLVTIRPKKDRFIFSVEGTGAMKPVSILRKALSILKLKLESLSASIEKPDREARS